MTKVYSSKANANRAAKTLAAKFTKEIESVGTTENNSLIVHMATPMAACEPEVLNAVEAHEVHWPAAPTREDSPVKQPNVKPYSEWDFSECETPVAVAHEIFSDFHKRGQLDDRKGAINAAIGVGVQKNTAATQYRRFRIMCGLPGAVNGTRK